MLTAHFTIGDTSFIPTIVGYRPDRQHQTYQRESALISIDTSQSDTLDPHQMMPNLLTANIRGGFVRKIDELGAVLKLNCVVSLKAG
jgi:hypothetical protein